MKKINKLWGSAFNKTPEESIIKFTAGRDVYPKKPADYHLVPYDLWGSKAHCIMLYGEKLIDKKDAQIILNGLQEIEKLWRKGDFTLRASREDVHTNVECWLVERYGMKSCGKLHTARSRNDQSSLDIRLYLRDQVLKFLQSDFVLIDYLVKQGKKYKDSVMPGFTHHQHATPTSFGHTLMAFASMITRDNHRLIDWFKLHNSNPLGSVTGYGSTLPINQETTTELFGFERAEKNSLDAITNRWETESDLAFDIAVLMNHLSILAETLIIFSSPEFGFVTLSDEHSTGSSIMPQKKNPDVLEVIKAKSNLAGSALQGLLGAGKGSFIGYNRDSQWTKYLIMDLIEECLSGPIVFAEVLSALTVNRKKMEKWAHKGFAGSTSLAEHLVANYQIPFREAKVIVEKSIKKSEGKDEVSHCSLLKVLEGEGYLLELNKDDVRKWQNPSWVLTEIKSPGGPNPESVEKIAESILREVKLQKKFLEEKIEIIKKGRELLNKEITKICQENKNI